ncbi:MAG: chemotaxis protein CheD [Nitrosomonadales bacterium]|nr:chemotaxis protein CheD [Nitrosomonadales bacterium]
MSHPEHVIDIFLQPGEFYFGDRGTRIRTLLGSCVAITMWHPMLRVGGMCHYMLPVRGGKPDGTLDGRYADEAMAMFQREIRGVGTRPEDYQVKVFGGGNMFSKQRHCELQQPCGNVACRNVQAARLLLDSHGHKVMAEHVGEHGHRNVVFDVWNGDVWMRHVKNGVLLEKAKEIEQDKCPNR